MSEAPELTETEALAAEHALGVLSGREREDADARMAHDAAFATDVETWRERFAPLLEEISLQAPPSELWTRIERQLPANDNLAAGRLRFWRGATAGSLSLAAASLAALVFFAGQGPKVVQVQAPPPPPGQLLNASLMTQSGKVQPMFVAAYDPDRQALIVTSLVPPGSDPNHVHELWLIPADGKPRALGFIEPGKAKTMPMPKTIEQLVAEGASLAVSVEAPGGSPNPNAPTGPITAVGKLAKL